MVDQRNFIDRMLEVENLTDALEDDDAKLLLNWGVKQLKQKLSSIEDNEAAGEYSNNLMGFMRTLNQIAGNLENVQPESLAQLAEYRRKALGPRQELAGEAYKDIAARIKEMTPRKAIEYLLQAD
jgi:hypothetical protein